MEGKVWLRFMIKIYQKEAFQKQYTTIKGFTLVEVITAFSIFILVVLILFKLYLPLNGLADKNSKENLTVLSSRTFQGPLISGSQFVSILGTEQIIIRKSDLRSGQTVLNLVSILGDSIIMVEKGIRVVNRSIPILGNSEVRFKDNKYDLSGKELIVSGTAILGNITIKQLKD